MKRRKILLKDIISQHSDMESFIVMRKMHMLN